MEIKLDEKVYSEKDGIDTSELNPENVYNLFKECMLRDSEIKDNKPTTEVTYAEGIVNSFALNTERLNKNQAKIAKLIEMLPIGSFPQTFLALCYDKNDRLWTGDHQVMELLMVLGIACGLIEYTFPQEKWISLPGSVPVINKTKKDIRERIVGHKPKEFPKIPFESEKRKLEEKKATQEKLRVKAKKLFEDRYKKAAPILEMFGYSMGMEEGLYYLYDSKGDKLCELSVSPILGGFTYNGVVNDTKVEYCYSCDGKNLDGGLIERDIISVNNVKRCDKTYSGKMVKVELGFGLNNVSDVPRIEVTILDPTTDEKITKYYADSYSLNFEIENNFGPYGNYENGTVRTVHYTNTSKTPFCNQGSLLLHESQQNGTAYNIYITRTNHYPETPATYSHKVAYYEIGNTSNPEVQECTLIGKNNANELACKYLKTSRVKNLYNHILTHIETEVTGMKDYIHQNYPFVINIEDIMNQEPDGEQEDLVNSIAIKGANVKEDDESVKKELKHD